MSFETDLAKFKKQVDSFSIAGASGNFHTGFSIGDDTRGAGAGVRTTEPNTPEEILTSLENSFKNFTIRGGHDVSVAGSLNAGGFAISVRGGVPQDGVGTGPPPPPPPATGACCYPDLDNLCLVQTEADCVECCPSGIYQGDDTVCDPDPCIPAETGACCIGDGGPDGSCSEGITEADCASGFWFGAGSLCSDNVCRCACPPPGAPTSVAVDATFHYDTICSDPDGVSFSFSGDLVWTGSDFLSNDCQGIFEFPISFPCKDPDGAFGNCDATCNGTIAVNLVMADPSVCHWAVVLLFSWTDSSGDHTCGVSPFSSFGVDGPFSITGPYTTADTCGSNGFSTFDSVTFS